MGSEHAADQLITGDNVAGFFQFPEREDFVDITIPLIIRAGAF
jgi:hypothetical protein